MKPTITAARPRMASGGRTLDERRFALLENWWGSRSTADRRHTVHAMSRIVLTYKETPTDGRVLMASPESAASDTRSRPRRLLKPNTVRTITRLNAAAIAADQRIGSW